MEQYGRTPRVEEFLATCHIPHYHLSSEGQVRSGNLCNGLRNTALQFMRSHRGNFTAGVVHFANTDRVYSASVFQKMRQVKRVGIWPTLLAREEFKCNPLMLNTFNSPYKYPVNVGSAGFSSSVLLDSTVTLPVSISDTAAVSLLIDQLVGSVEEIEVVSCDGRFIWFIPFF